MKDKKTVVLHDLKDLEKVLSPTKPTQVVYLDQKSYDEAHKKPYHNKVWTVQNDLEYLGF